MAHYRLHCIGASGNSYKLALYMNCAGLDWEPVGVDFAGGQTRDAAWRAGTNVMGEVPVLIIPCISAPHLSARSQAGLWGSLLPAAWSYMLAARARGLGTAWTTLHLRYEKEISELLRIPADIRQGVLIPTAYYIGDTFRPAPRQPLDAALHINAW